MNKFYKCINPIKTDTGLDIEIYNAVGDRVAATDPETVRLTEELPSFDGTVFQDKRQNATYFRAEVQGESYVGVIAGAGEVSRNYASLVSRLIESSFTAIEKATDRTADLRALLAGELNRAQTERFEAKYGDERDYYILVFETNDRRALTEYLNDLVPETDTVLAMTKKSVVLVKEANSFEEYQSPSDFAHMVAENAQQEGLRTTVGVGDCARDLAKTAGSYRQALSALRLGKLLDPKARIYNIKDYFLVSLFEEMPEERVRGFLAETIDEGLRSVFDDLEMMDTAEQFMLGSLNISETARNMYMHRNTLIYRLDKIEKATGLNIRRFSDAMTFRTLSMLYKLNRKEGK